MRVSVVIPTYNGASFIGSSLDSVFGQTMEDFEVVVTDDGSTDETLEIVRSYDDPRLVVIADTSRLGAEGNWNRALTHASAPYVKLLPQDDLMYPEVLQRQVDVLDGDASLSFVAARRDIVGSDGTVLVRDRGLRGLCGRISLERGSRAIVRSGTNQFGEGAAILFRREVARAVGEFDGSIPYVIDVDFWHRLLKWGPALGLCETLAAFRVSGTSWSKALAREQSSQYRRFIQRVASDPACGVKARDVTIGRGYAWRNAVARRAFYTRYRSHM